jgi:hypothetical protein
MVQPLNPLWDSEGNLLVPRYGIRIAIRLALLAAGAYWLFTLLEDRELRKLNPLQPSAFPHSVWVTILWIALPFVPFLLSGLLLSCRSEEAVASGAGVAAALFLCSFLFSIAALLGFAFLFGPIPYALPLAISNLMFSVCSIWIIVSAFRIGSKASWGLFFLALAMTLVGMVGAYHLLGGP